MSNQMIWPVYFTKKALTSRNIVLEPGDAFPYQDKMSIRMLGPAMGCPEAMNLPWQKLPYVLCVNVRDRVSAEKIKALKLKHHEAERVAAEAAQGKAA